MTNPTSQPVVTLIQSPLLRGQSQFLGGAVGGPLGNEKIYCIPGHASRVLVIDPRDDSTRSIGPNLPGHFKWLRGLRVPSTGIIYGIPCHHNHVLRIDPFTDAVSLVPLPSDIDGSSPWKYHGGTLCPIDNCIYAIPQYAERVLKIDPQNDCISLVGQSIVGQYKFYGGVVGSDGAIYGIPQNASAVLRIDPLCRSKPNEVVTLHGNFGSGGYKWHGASALHNGDVIIGIPCHANSVLKIEPGHPEPMISLEGDETIVKSGRHQPEHKYKFLGAVTNVEGTSVYCIPSGAERVLRIHLVRNNNDTIKVNTMRYRAILDEVGANLRDEGLERFLQNKWQNGFTSKVDKAMYAIPLNAERVLRITPFVSNQTGLDSSTDDDESRIFQQGGEQRQDRVTVETIGDPVTGMSKWEGCVVAPNGVAYAMPNNCKGILKIIPAGIPLDEMNR